MSISTLAGEMESALVRGEGKAPARETAQEGWEEMAPAEKSESGSAPGFDALTRYIPTETITIYVGALAARDELAEAFGLGVWGIYAICACATPLLLVLVTVAKHRSAGRSERIAWHWWPFAASLIGFMVWGTSVPGHPYADELNALPALGALIASVLLSLLDPILLPRGHKIAH